MPTRGYVSIGIPEELVDVIDQFLKSHPLRRNRNQFVVDAIRHYLPVAKREAKLLASIQE